MTRVTPNVANEPRASASARLAGYAASPNAGAVRRHMRSGETTAMPIRGALRVDCAAACGVITSAARAPKTSKIDRRRFIQSLRPRAITTLAKPAVRGRAQPSN